MPTRYAQQQADRLTALKSALIGKTIASIHLYNLFHVDHEQLAIWFTDRTSLIITGAGSSCGTAGYLRFESPTVKIDPN